MIIGATEQLSVRFLVFSEQNGLFSSCKAYQVNHSSNSTKSERIFLKRFHMVGKYVCIRFWHKSIDYQVIMFLFQTQSLPYPLKFMAFPYTLTWGYLSMGNISDIDRSRVTKLWRKVVWGNTFQSIWLKMTFSQGQGHSVTLKGWKMEFYVFVGHILQQSLETFTTLLQMVRPLQRHMTWCPWPSFKVTGGPWIRGKMNFCRFFRHVLQQSLETFAMLSPMARPLSGTYDMIALNLVQGHKVNSEKKNVKCNKELQGKI